MSKPKPDIVARLRDWASTICTVNSHVPLSSKAQMAKDAAAEIERLRAELVAMREQRDDARRRVCELSLIKNLVYRKLDGVDGRFIECKTPEEIAQVYDWDCFEEGCGA